jgi:hypothetical protein
VIKPDDIVEFLIRKVEEVLRDNTAFPQASDEIAVKTIRSLMGAADSRLALERGSDRASAFVLRAINLMISDNSLSARETLSRARTIMGELKLQSERAPIGIFGAGSPQHIECDIV